MKGIILFGHGARAADYIRPFERIRAAMAAREPGALVDLGCLEVTPPSLEESVASLVSRGVSRISVVPVFIGPGRHVLKDLPQLAADAMDRHPGLEITLAPPVGESAAVIEAMANFALDT